MRATELFKNLGLNQKSGSIEECGPKMIRPLTASFHSVNDPAIFGTGEGIAVHNQRKLDAGFRFPRSALCLVYECVSE